MPPRLACRHQDHRHLGGVEMHLGGVEMAIPFGVTNTCSGPEARTLPRDAQPRQDLQPYTQLYKFKYLYHPLV